MTSTGDTAPVPAPTPTPEDAVGAPRVREIYKNGWLFKLPTWEKKTPLAPFAKIPKPERYWAVFCVHDDAEAFLEYYETHQSSLAHQPLSRVNLSECLHVSPSIMCQWQTHAFVITLDSSAIRLATTTRDLMLEWVEIMRNKLRELGVLEPSENVYSREPELKPTLAPIRDPTSPLPPTPGYVHLPPGTVSPATPPIPDMETASQVVHNPFLDYGTHETPEDVVASAATAFPEVPRESQQMADSTPDQYILRHYTGVVSAAPYGRHSHPVAPTSPAALVAAAPMSAPVLSQERQQQSIPESVFNFDFASLSLNDRLPAPSTNPFLSSSGSQEDESNASSIYEPLHLAHTPTFLVTDGSRRQPNVSSSGEHTSTDRETQGMRAVPDGASLPLSLKEAQVLQLQREISHPGGVRLRLRHKDCHSSIAFTDYLGAAWVAGWKQKEKPLLHNSFHIGDRIMSVGGLQVSSSQEAHRAIKQMSPPFIEFVVARVPMGKVFAIKRDQDGQDLGLIRENNTAEIREVVGDGLAARHGLPLQAISSCGSNLCNWVLTEVNGRPLNLFFKDGEIQDRLNAVGKDISILVQPLDLIKVLKKQLKSMRSYKDYIVQ